MSYFKEKGEKVNGPCVRFSQKKIMKRILNGIKTEFCSLTYPKRKELIMASVIVIVSSVILAALIALDTTAISELCGVIARKF